MKKIFEKRYVSDGFLFFIYATFVFAIWILNPNLFLIFDFEPFLSKIFTYSKIKSNLNLFIFLCFASTVFRFFGIFCNYIIFYPSFKNEKIKIYWTKLFLKVIIDLALASAIVHEVMGVEKRIIHDFVYFLLSMGIAFSIAGIFPYFIISLLTLTYREDRYEQ